jgi:hypothetical protein
VGQGKALFKFIATNGNCKGFNVFTKIRKPNEPVNINIPVAYSPFVQHEFSGKKELLRVNL